MHAANHKTLAPCLLGTLVILLTACPSPEEPLDLAEVLGPNEVRAGIITKADELLGGPTAEGSIGDFKLYNSKIAVIVEAPGPSHGYDIYGGKIVDADVIRPKGEQGWSNFGELYFTWQVRTFVASSAEIVNDGSDGKAAHLRVRGTDDVLPILHAALGPMFGGGGKLDFDVTIDYILEPGAEHLKIRTTVLPKGERGLEVSAHFTGFMQGDGLRVFAPGPGFDGLTPKAGVDLSYIAGVGEKVSYSFVTPGEPIRPIAGYDAVQLIDVGSFSAQPEEAHTSELILVVGNGDLQRHEAVHRELLTKAGEETQEVHEVTGEVREGGQGVSRATIHVLSADGKAYLSQTRSDSEGRFKLYLPKGDYQLRATSHGRDPGDLVELSVSGDTETSVEVGPSAKLGITATEKGEPVPVKVQGLRKSPPPQLETMYGVEGRYQNYERVEFLLPETTELALSPGDWEIFVSRGFEYEVEHYELSVKAGSFIEIDPKMKRVVDTTGWLSGDFHIHSQYSPDSDDLVEHKVKAIAAENVEIPVSTEHDYISDFQPTIEKLGLQRFARSVIGLEVSTISYGHFNAFPLKRDPAKANYGAINWLGVKGPDLMDKIRSYPTDPIIQVNHPRTGHNRGLFDNVELDAATFKSSNDSENWTVNYDAVEIANRNAPGERNFRDWYAFLDRGLRLLGTGNSDSHTSRSDMVGFPRNYVRTGVDEVENLDMDDYFAALRAGKLVVSGGIFLDITSGKHGPGSLVPMAEIDNNTLPLRLKVQAPSWVPVGDIEVILNGESALLIPADELDHGSVIRLDKVVELQVPTKHDSHVIVWARGNGRLDPVHPRGNAFGFSNPIFVDANGNGKFDARIPYP